MKQGKREFIRINLNRRKSLIETLKTLDISSVKEFVVENVYPVVFIASVIVLIITALINFYMKRKAEELDREIAVARERKNRVLSDIRHLRERIASIEFEQKLAERLKEYNTKVLESIEEVNRLPKGLVLQNFSLCAKLNTGDCDINRASEVILGKPMVQLDIVAFRESLDLSKYELLRQTYVELGGYPIKRFCVQKKYTVETAKR